VAILRDAFYTDGFYVEITDQFTGEPLLRAQGLLEISTFPFLEPCSFPPCARTEPEYPPLKGTVNFATSRRSAGGVTVYLNGEDIGLLNQPVSLDDVPACGLEGDGRTLAAEMWPESYYWHAHGADGTFWDGHVTITGDSCETILLE
jgi:hypothetical protein